MGEHLQLGVRELLRVPWSGSTIGDLDMMTGGKDGAYERMVGICPAMATGGSGGDCSASGSQRIVAGDADASLLIRSSRHGGRRRRRVRRPHPIRTPLTQAQIDVIRDWIDAGAENN
ncbi:MAG: hypothetical protein R3A78_04965 [Polyangiales bacterium]